MLKGKRLCLREPHPCAFEHFLGILLRKLHRAVCASRIDQDDVVSPFHAFQAVDDPLLLIERNDNNRQRGAHRGQEAVCPGSAAILRATSAAPTVNQSSTAISWSPKFHSNKPLI